MAIKLFALNTLEGLKPLNEDDYDKKKRLEIGEVYQITLVKPRNMRLHRKYFQLIRTAWEFQSEAVQAHFGGDVNNFRKSVEIAAGWYDTIYSIARNEFVQVPKSISLGDASGDEFENIYESVRHVLFTVFLKHITPEEFDLYLINF